MNADKCAFFQTAWGTVAMSLTKMESTKYQKKVFLQWWQPECSVMNHTLLLIYIIELRLLFVKLVGVHDYIDGEVCPGTVVNC